MATCSDDAHAARLGRADRAAAGAIKRAPSVHFDLARSARDREAVFRLRYQVVVERGWAPAGAMPNGLERDVDDDRAVLVAGWDGGRLVAAGRILYPAPGCRLPVERVFDLTIEPGDQVAHIDRLCVARAPGESSHRIFAALIGRCWLELRAHGAHACGAIASAAMVRIFRRVGFTVTSLGPPRSYWNEQRYPVLFDPGTTSSILADA